MGVSVSKLDHVVTEGGRTFPEQRRDYDLRACFSRHRTLDSTWSVVALFGFSNEDHFVVKTTGAIGKELEALSATSQDDRDPVAIDKIHANLEALETEVRTIVREIPLEKMRSALPDQIREDRRSVVDLLDLMLGAENEPQTSGGGRVTTLDYVITALCTIGGHPGTIEDPLTLSPRLYGRCEIAAELDDPRAADVAAEFLRATDNAKSVSLNKLKSELGELLFVPDVLRTVVGYNTALWDEVATASNQAHVDEGPGVIEEEGHGEATTVFVTSTLPKLGEALRRRCKGEPQSNSPIDRVAWHLDIDFPTPEERGALLSPMVGRRTEIAGTTILVGLLSKSATVLAEEFDPIGLSANQLNGEWSRELNHLIKTETARMIAADGYDEACALSDLRTKYLYLGVANVEREIRRAPAAPSAKEQFSTIREQATEIASEAAVSAPTPAPARAEDDQALMRRGILARGGSIALAALAIAGMAFAILYTSDGLTGVASDELGLVSPYLASGRANAAGEGASFVGIVHPEWSELEREVQQVLAEEIVEALRDRGTRQIMIYDDADNLRIQALGSQPVRLMDPVE